MPIWFEPVSVKEVNERAQVGIARVIGLEINANHLAAAKDGWVTAVARPVHLGRTTQVWDIRITNAEGKLSCISRCTMAIIERK